MLVAVFCFQRRKYWGFRLRITHLFRQLLGLPCHVTLLLAFSSFLVSFQDVIYRLRNVWKGYRDRVRRVMLFYPSSVMTDYHRGNSLNFTDFPNFSIQFWYRRGCGRIKVDANRAIKYHRWATASLSNCRLKAPQIDFSDPSLSVCLYRRSLQLIFRRRNL